MKRSKADSTTEQIKAMSDASKAPLEPPVHVTLVGDAILFWPGIIDSRARDEWTDTDLVVAAQLAQCQADIADNDMIVRDEGFVIGNTRGTPVMNPRSTLIENLTRREMALMRTLRMGGHVSGDPRDDSKRRKIQKESEKIKKELEEEDLLA